MNETPSRYPTMRLQIADSQNVTPSRCPRVAAPHGRGTIDGNPFSFLTLTEEESIWQSGHVNIAG